jgi:hypothetical protein
VGYVLNLQRLPFGAAEQDPDAADPHSSHTASATSVNCCAESSLSVVLCL